MNEKLVRKAVIAERGKPRWRMLGSGWIHETHGYRFRVKVYLDERENASFDNATVCVDGGYDDLREMWAADSDKVWCFANDMYTTNGAYPGGHLGRPLKPHEISDSLRESIITRLESGWAEGDEEGE